MTVYIAGITVFGANLMSNKRKEKANDDRQYILATGEKVTGVKA